jgi:coenzyme F420-0:L-glutamate ligase / coenzyme F420-1:gamma-L-glutamate ligase
MPAGEDDTDGSLTILPVQGVGEVEPGDDLGALLSEALSTSSHGPAARTGDVLVVTQKVVSKAEGRIVVLGRDEAAERLALVERESVRVLRRRDELVISETSHGFICANAGVDVSNVAAGTAALLPSDPDRSARRLAADVDRRLRVRIGVVISDTFGRAWRRGVTDVAIGCAGIAAIIDLRGTPDATGRPLVATELCVADEIAGAAELVMGKDRGVPAAIVRGVPSVWLRAGSVAEEVVRPPAEDLFR